MHPGNEGEPDTVTVGELAAKLSGYASDWPIVVRVCGMKSEGDPQDLRLSVKNFDCALDPEDIHADRGTVIFCTGNDELEQLIHPE